MEDKILKCPSCSGQMMLTEAKPGDKIAKCKYCNTIVDLPDTAENQGFDLNGFFKGLNLNKNSTTITTNTVIIKDGQVINANGGDQEDTLKFVNDVLKNAGINIEGLNNSTNINVQSDIKPEE